MKNAPRGGQSGGGRILNTVVGYRAPKSVVLVVLLSARFPDSATSFASSLNGVRAASYLVAFLPRPFENPLSLSGSFSGQYVDF